MSDTTLEVKVIYDSSSSGRKLGATVVRTGVNTKRWLIVGLINVLVAGVLYYGVWWRVDRDIVYPALILHSTIPLGSFGVQYSADGSELVATKPTPPKIDAHTIKLWSAAYGWRTLMPIAFCMLALSAGALFGRFFGPGGRRIGFILFAAALLGLAIAVYVTLNRDGMQYKVSAFRWFLGCVAGTLLLLGVSIGRGVRGLAKTAALFLVLAATGCAVGMYMFRDLGVLEPKQATTTMIALVFVVVSLWGWILWPVASRLPR